MDVDGDDDGGSGGGSDNGSNGSDGRGEKRTITRNDKKMYVVCLGLAPTGDFFIFSVLFVYFFFLFLLLSFAVPVVVKNPSYTRQ